MPFDPLPGILTDCLSDLVGAADAAPARAVELGCGEGRLLALLRLKGLECMGLDRRLPAPGSAAGVVGDACRPPLRPASCDLILAANLLRHLMPSHPRAGFLADWVALLKPGGSVFILEDEPTERPAAAAHYRDLQAFLARLSPESRGPLVPLTGFLTRLPDRLRTMVTASGISDNVWPQDAAAAVAMLAAGKPVVGGEAHRLATAITADGLTCGRQWWCRLQAHPQTD